MIERSLPLPSDEGRGPGGEEKRRGSMRTLLLLLLVPTALAGQRPRARDLGLAPGIFPTGRWNAITDVAGVRVGQVTIDQGDSVHTGVTAIIPEDSNTFGLRLPAAIRVGNGFGKLLGVTQVQELGEIESPILLTCTPSVWRVAAALAGWMLARPGMGRVRSFNPVVGETNGGGLSAIRDRPIKPEDVVRALE